mgnify:FL=1
MAFIETLQEYLKKEGFLPELTEFGLQFKYETLDFVSFKDEQDELFLNLFFPQIFKAEENTQQDVLTALNMANLQTKAAKGALHPDNFVWVGVECVLSENYDLEDIVTKSLKMMQFYREAFYHAYAQTPSGKAALEAAQKGQ